MKKIFTIIIGLAFFSSSSMAQSSWRKIEALGNVVIEMKTEECNPNERLHPHTYSLFRYTNISDKPIEFNFEMILSYNGKEQDNTPKDSGDPSQIKNLKINANSSLTGDCDSTEEYFRVFSKHSNLDMNFVLTKVQFIQK